MTPDDRVRRLVEEARIAPEEGERLLVAMSRAPKASWLSIAVNPFERFGGGVAVGVGAIVSVLSVVVGRLGVRFDGFLDMHVNPMTVPSLRVSVLEQIPAWLLPACVFWIYARVFTRHARWLDFVGMTGLARLPVLLSALATVALLPADSAIRATTLTPALLAVAAFGLVFLAANITLLYQGFKNASGLSGARLVVGFIAMLIASETLSKLVVLFLLPSQ